MLHVEHLTAYSYCEHEWKSQIWEKILMVIFLPILATSSNIYEQQRKSGDLVSERESLPKPKVIFS